uniref:Phospholipid-transporting ATPase n=1 Tax=Hyaloperonospora arabidopsidis (strain Emoy2) TaxID=559515 RepID=M4BEY8_HYAAE
MERASRDVGDASSTSSSSNNEDASDLTAYHRLPSPPAAVVTARVEPLPPVRAPVTASADNNPSKFFHRNQTVDVLPRDPSWTVPKERHNHDLFRTFTSQQPLAGRPRLLHDNDHVEAHARLQSHGASANAAAAPRHSASWRLFYRNLPRSLRFRQNTRSTTRYIDPANAASLRSRVRARKHEEHVRDAWHTPGRDSFDDEDAAPASAREMTDFEREMLMMSARAGDVETEPTDGTTGSRRGGGAKANGGASRKHLLDRMSSLMSTDSQQTVTAGRDGGKQFKIVKINDGNNAPKRVPRVSTGHDGDDSGGDGNATTAAGDEEVEVEEFFVSNEVKTSQYTWWSFVPVFLYLTFQKTANLYFLLIGIFQMIPSVSPTNGVPLQFIPLAIVTVIDGIFAGYEDYKRHMADDLANSAKTRVYNRQLREFEEVEWRELKVGDFVKVGNREILPADIMIMAVIPAEGARSNGNTGLCYVETKNLDGETNLKLREAPASTRNSFQSEEEAGYIVQGYVESELPNADINTYSGTIHLEESPTGANSGGVPLTLKNMLLRGSKLRNTSYVYGLVVNTGVDTKIMMSSGDEFSVKVSSIDEMTNKQVIVVVVILVLMSFIGAAGDRIWMNGLITPPYMELDGWDDNFIVTFVYFFTTLASMVPITLYVSITLVKALQGYFMERDLDMYDEASGTPVKVRNMQLNEQLGQISHIFSDKTGTLTCNKMEFRKCSIGGRSYGKGTTAIGVAARIRNDYKGEQLQDDESADEKDVLPFDARAAAPTPNVKFNDKTIWQDMQAKGDPQSGKIEEFMTLLALCHGVLIERLDPCEEDVSPSISYSASSPDELALVCGAKHFGYEFIDRESGSVSVKKFDGTVDQYDILEVFEFDSNRKRMSVVVQRRKRDDELRLISECEEEDVLILTKGADSMLFPRLDPISANNREVCAATEKHLAAFAQDGLRTLVVCAKRVRPQVWEQFYAKYRHMSADLNEVQAKSLGEPNGIDKLQDQMESNLELLGATAIEDRLQDGVPATMESLAKAGICIWVLTGDMEETAINIGYACRLLNNDMKRHVINAAKYRTKGSILRKLDKVFHSINDVNGDESHAPTVGAFSALSLPPASEEHALVIDGASLNKILEDPLHNLHLLRVSLLCKVVVACRVSPQQKAQLVELVKLNVPESHTLSIGDGANDVPMIQSAHIGIGISGQEGLQAVNSSDYSLAQFKFLSNLILVHGRWNYNRIAALVVYTFYKNIAYNVSMFWHTLWPTAYSGTMVYSALIQQGFNLVFTALPIVIFSVYDKDLPKKTVLMFPALYHAEARRRSFFSHIMFWKWIALGIVDSVGIYYAILATGWNIERGGNTIEFLSLQTLGWTILCIVVNVRFCLMVNSWDILEIGSIVLTVLTIYVSQYAIDQIDWIYDTDSLPWQFGRPQFWLGQAFAVVAILLKDFLYEGFRRRFLPEYMDLVKETQHDTSSISCEELTEFKPPPVNYLNSELAGMIDYQDRRVHESTSIGLTAPRRSELYTGFAFDKPANIFNWILSGTTNNGGQLCRKKINADVRNAILNSDDPVLFENQRYQPFCGYGSSFPGYLLPTDRKRWSDRSGKISAQALPMAGLELNMDVAGCDADGWVYEKDFAFFPSIPPNEDGEEENEDEVASDTGRRSSTTSFLTSRVKSKKKKAKKARPHHGFVRRREWKLSDEYKAQEESRRALDSSSVVESDDNLGQ